ncbi:MAG TPA: hypothetical protein VF143_07135 [Candidatus Nanopelagicales bacterium]
MGTYLKMAERKAMAREAARALLRDEGVPIRELSLKQVAAHLEWPLGTLHRAYSVIHVLRNDLLLEYEDETFHAVYRIGDGGLAAELNAQAARMRARMGDEANMQLMRYQMALGCASVDPIELPLRHSRDSSWEFHRDLLVQISVAADEEYEDLNALASIVTAFHDGLTYQCFNHRDPDRWLADMRRAIGIAVQFAQPRKVEQRSSLADQRWTADQMPARRRELLRAASPP